YRHSSKAEAERFFLDGMTRAMQRLAEQAHPAFPITIYYAYKQQETRDDTSADDAPANASRVSPLASTGWETFLDAVIRAGFAISGTWPMRTEMRTRQVAMETNALASSIVLVCRPRRAPAPAWVAFPSPASLERGAGGEEKKGVATRREFIAALKEELPSALVALQQANIAPVDLAQAAIGPGMAIFTRYSAVRDAQGKAMTVREALALINQALDEILTAQEGDFDAETRWALAWFEQHGFAEGEFGVAETLSKARATSIDRMVALGMVEAKRGKVRLLRPEELRSEARGERGARREERGERGERSEQHTLLPSHSSLLTPNPWLAVHLLAHALMTDGEMKAAELAARMGGAADLARELAYRLYTICERRKRAQEALAYNALVQSWSEIVRLAQERRASLPAQSSLFDE
ncbi:MAG: hypothetical protein NZM94_01355, partial [Roseiflexus sp.]|nr:hypothetical protein [Roseiflexus sp.]